MWALLFLAFVVFGAKKGFLVYRMDVRCQNRPPTVRDAFSKALGAKNRLLVYGICIRCKKKAPGVRDAFSEAFGVKNRLLVYRMEIRCKKQPPLVRDAFSITEEIPIYSIKYLAFFVSLSVS